MRSYEESKFDLNFSTKFINFHNVIFPNYYSTYVFCYNLIIQFLEVYIIFFDSIPHLTSHTDCTEQRATIIMLEITLALFCVIYGMTKSRKIVDSDTSKTSMLIVEIFGNTDCSQFTQLLKTLLIGEISYTSNTIAKTSGI